jgi:hypothetical protein
MSLLLPLLLAGCANPPAVEPPAPPAELGAAFDPVTAGTVRGTVTWRGPLPAAPPVAGVIADGTELKSRPAVNPFALRVNDAGGLADVLVTLDGVDPAKSRPWDHNPVSLSIDDFDYRLKQGHRPTRVGIVRAGTPVTFETGDAEVHAVRGRGADFFTLTLPFANKPRSRVMTPPGVVELTSGAGYFWNAVDLCVRVDPYAAVTDAAGRYELSQVPPGNYTLTFRIRNPRVTGVERDPETGLPFRQTFAPPATRSFPVAVSAAGTVTHDFAADPSLFETP